MRKWEIVTRRTSKQSVHVDFEDPRRFDSSLSEELDWSERPAFLLGVDLGAICAARHLQRIREFARRVTAPEGRERQWLLQAAPGWRRDDQALLGRIAALLAGLGGA